VLTYVHYITGFSEHHDEICASCKQCQTSNKFYGNLDSGIQVILRLLLKQFERLQYLYYQWVGFMKYTIEMASGSMMSIPSFIKINIGIQKLLEVIHIHAHMHAQMPTHTCAQIEGERG
jgi:hypothetical protein